MPPRGERLGLVWVGQLQVAGFLICSIIGLAIVPAGRAVARLYDAALGDPDRAVLVARAARPQPARRAAVSFAGLILFMNPGLVSWRNGQVLAGNTLLLLAAFAWALGSCLYRRRLWRSSFWVQTLWQLAVSIIPVGGIVLIGAIVPAGPVGGGPVHWSPALIAILADNCIVTTAVGLFSLGQGLGHDAGRDGRTSTDAASDRLFRSVYPHIRRRDHSRCGGQHRVYRRRNLHYPATVMRWFYCRPQNRIGQEELHRHSPRPEKSWEALRIPAYSQSTNDQQAGSAHPAEKPRRHRQPKFKSGPSLVGASRVP